MYLGEVKVLQIGDIERVAIGNPKVASNSILPKGQLVILADSSGATTMHIWLKDGGEKQFDVVVKEKKTLDNYLELSKLLADIPGIHVEKIGEQTVIKGRLSERYKQYYLRIMARYKNVLDLVQPGEVRDDISRLLEDIPNIKIRDIGGYTVISGETSQEYANLIKLAESKFNNVLNMTRVHDAVAGKMIVMQVKIMEMSKSFSEKLGINWNVSNILGPSLAFGVEGVTNGATILNADNVSKVFTKAGAANLTTGTGYFGIATGITSLIDLSESTGDGVVLAEPRLSTRSGGKAEFLAGGEFPVPTSNSLGATNVEFKKYGISLNVAPVVDDMGNILAHIETEISTIDNANAVNDVPGVLSRKTSTDVSMRADQTLVIAGLLQDLVSVDYNKVKWLGNLPVLGPLFRSKNFNNQASELVIFITPVVYDTSSITNTNALKQGEKINAELEKLVGGPRLLD